MAPLVNVRCPQAKTKKQAIACFAFTDTCRVADVSSRYDGKPCRASDLDRPHPAMSPLYAFRHSALDTDTVQIRYAQDRKVTIVTMRDIDKASRDDLPMPAHMPHKVTPQSSYADVYRECVIALNCLDADDDAPHRWRDRLPLYALATRQYRAAIDLGDLDERTIATRARDAAFRGAIACK